MCLIHKPRPVALESASLGAGHASRCLIALTDLTGRFVTGIYRY